MNFKFALTALSAVLADLQSQHSVVKDVVAKVPDEVKSKFQVVLDKAEEDVAIAQAEFDAITNLVQGIAPGSKVANALSSADKVVDKTATIAEEAGAVASGVLSESDGAAPGSESNTP